MNPIIIIVLFLVLGVLLYLLNKNKLNVETYYSKLNMSSGESPWKCGSCTQYGSLFDYKAQKSDRTYGVPNGCQKIF